jgi:hypothetical protein
VRGRILTQTWAIAGVYVPRNDQTALKRCLQRFGAASFGGFKCSYRPWIAKTTAQVRTEPAIIMTSGFAIAIPRGQTQAAGIFPLNVSQACPRHALHFLIRTRELTNSFVLNSGRISWALSGHPNAVTQCPLASPPCCGPAPSRARCCRSPSKLQAACRMPYGGPK